MTGQRACRLWGAAALGILLVLAFLPAAAKAGPRLMQKAVCKLDQPDEFLYWGEVSAAAGRFGEAKRYLRAALRLRPGWRPARRKLAGLRDERRRFRILVRSCGIKGFQRLDYIEGINQFNRGCYLHAMGFFQRYVKHFPRDPRGRRYLRLAQREAAMFNSGSLVVHCNAKAVVYFNGHRVGLTPLTLEQVSAGRHLIRVQGYGIDASRQVLVRRRTNTMVRFDISGGWLSVHTDKWAEVYLNGRMLGQTPMVALGLPVGPVQVVLKRVGYQPVSKEVVLRADQQVWLHSKMQRTK